jgi:carbonic anhydrase/acetyltransferase-like protein (isoleucine patch superfamily)
MTPLGTFAPAARQVHEPSGCALVSSISILRDIEINRIRSGALNSIDRARSGYGSSVPIYALDDQEPVIHPTAYISPEAVIIGSVTIGAHSSIWPGAVLRGDDGAIIIGARTSIQDNSVLHTTPQDHTTVGDDCVIGHIVHLEGCIIENNCLIGNASMVLHRSRICSGAIVAANSVVLYDVEVPSGALAAGSPAVIKPGRARREDIEMAAASYVERAARFHKGLRRIG